MYLYAVLYLYAVFVFICCFLISGIKSVTVDVSNQRVVVETDQPSSVIQNALESTGMLAVFRGQGRLFSMDISADTSYFLNLISFFNGRF